MIDFSMVWSTIVWSHRYDNKVLYFAMTALCRPIFTYMYAYTATHRQCVHVLLDLYIDNMYFVILYFVICIMKCIFYLLTNLLTY